MVPLVWHALVSACHSESDLQALHDEVERFRFDDEAYLASFTGAGVAAVEWSPSWWEGEEEAAAEARQVAASMRGRGFTPARASPQ